MPKGEGNVVAQNKKARHDYNIVDTCLLYTSDAADD